MSAIYILWLRELKRYTRSRVQIIASLGQPMLYLMVLGFGLGPVFQRAGSGSYLQFVAPGVIGMTVLFSSIFSGLGLLWDRQFGFLKETLVAPVPRLQIMIGRTLGGATVAVIQGLLVTLVCVLAGFRPVNLAMVPLALATSLDPLSYGIDGMRSVLLGKAHYGATIDAEVLAVVAAVLLVFGAHRFSKIEI
jgi:ABC-2 type transport system permease protein